MQDIELKHTLQSIQNDFLNNYKDKIDSTINP